MKNPLNRLSVLLLLISLGLSACQLLPSATQDQDEDIVTTMVALALTQTAVVETLLVAPTETPDEEPTMTPPIIEDTPEGPTAPQEIVHLVRPDEPGLAVKWFSDMDSSGTGGQGYTTDGDDFTRNLFERPFTEETMEYRPDIDIIRTEISSDSTFIYVQIQLIGEHPDGGLQAAYGVEIDYDLDGRGDLLVIVDRPTSSEWSIEGVSVHHDLNKDVGGETILRPDDNYQGDSYEQILFSTEHLSDPDMAFARVNPGNLATVSLAFKKSILPDSTFVWGVWAAENLLDPALFDLHDHFTEAEAGSPYITHSNYPLGAINLVDNTCRETFNFVPTVPIPGLCAQPEATPTPTVTATQTATATPTATETLAPETGDIWGVAFNDLNSNGMRDDGEPLTGQNVTISLRMGMCSDPVYKTISGNLFGFLGLTPGNYCISINPFANMTTPSSYNIVLPPGEAVYVEFGYGPVLIVP